MRQFTNMLVCIAQGGSDSAVRYAARLAAASGAAITLTEVMDEGQAIVRPVFARGWDVPLLARTQALARLKRAVARVRRLGVDPRAVLLVGPPVKSLVREVAHGNHDLLVIGAPSAHAVRAVGTTAARLVRECPSPVLLVHRAARRRRSRVLVAIDTGRWRGRVTDAATATLFAAALWFVRVEGGTLHVLHVWDAPGEPIMRRAGATDASLRRYVAEVREELGRELDQAVAPFRKHLAASRIHLKRGDPRKVIAAFATAGRYDLVVMGTVARKGLAGRIIGNTAEAVLGKLRRSLLVVKPGR